MSGGEEAGGQNLHKAISYVVVGINSIAESKKLFQFLRSNGYADVSLFHDYPEAKNNSEMAISTLDQTASGSSAPLNELCKSFNGAIEELFSDREAKIFNEQLGDNHFCCALCGCVRPLVDARIISKKKDQIVVFFSCLLMENDTDIDTAVKVYKQSQNGSKRVCQDHYIKAASFIGREIKEMWGKFPLYGLHNVPLNILEVFLAHVQVFGDCIDEEIFLETYDITRFFNECLARYYSADGWNVEEMTAKHRKSRKRKQKGPETADYEKAVSLRSESKPRTSTSTNGHESPLFTQPKQEPIDECEGISATVLLDQSVPSPCSIATFDSTLSLKGEDLEKNSCASNKIKEKSRSPDEDKASTSASVTPIRIIGDPLNCNEALAERKFRQRFRMSRNTFKILCHALDPYLAKRSENRTKKSTDIKVGTALEVLAGNGYALRDLNLMGSSVTEIFEDVLDALLEWSGTVIQWPGEEERSRIEERFFDMTGLTNVVGCLDGTIIGTPHSSDESSKGYHALNVAVVADDKKLFRWVLAKYRADVEDELVFKRSLLCQQLREGAKKGRLIGDDAYNREAFLLTPNSGRRFKKEEQLTLNATLSNAHKTVQEAISSWKLQFPILTGDIMSPKVARIIVGTAAVYNLTRSREEPPFTSAEEDNEVNQRWP